MLVDRPAFDHGVAGDLLPLGRQAEAAVGLLAGRNAGISEDAHEGLCILTVRKIHVAQRYMDCNRRSGQQKAEFELAGATAATIVKST